MGDMKSQVQGQAKQVQGAAEDLYGQAKDAAGELTDVVRNTIETRPYTAVAVALASAGCSVGRTGRFRQSRSSGRVSNLCEREDGNVPGCLLLRFSQPGSLRRSFRPRHNVAVKLLAYLDILHLFACQPDFKLVALHLAAC
jgi:hypothetical protein